MDLEKLSRAELVKLRTEVELALESLDTRRKAEARGAAEAIARQHGFNLADLVEAEKAGKKKGQKNPAKYRNPANPSQTWTGRGHQPGWIKEALDAGKSLDVFEI